MKNFKFLTLGLSLGALTLTLPYISAQALPIDDMNAKQAISPLSIFNMEDETLKRNQKEEMAEVLVNLYNKYNSILKKGLELNDVQNCNLYFNITQQKSQIKELLDDIINYPYSVVNKDIEQKFLKSNILFCHLTTQYIEGENLDYILNSDNINTLKYDLDYIKEIINFSIEALENSEGNYCNIDIKENLSYLNTLVDNIYDMDSFNENKENIKNTINNISSDMDFILENYMYI